MFLLRKPSDTQIHDYLARQADQPYSYDHLGCTREEPTKLLGWNIDSHRVLLGHGEQTFDRAGRAIDTWQMFPSEITTVFDCETLTCSVEVSRPRPSHEAQTVAVLYCAAPLPLYLLMPARVAYLIDDTIENDGHTLHRHGFAYGTLPDHPERGEELFLVEWNRGDDSVWYKLRAVSQPSHWLVRLGYPYTRLEQSRFRRLSGAAMQRAVRQG